jgi:hypothetical protein
MLKAVFISSRVKQKMLTRFLAQKEGPFRIILLDGKSISGFDRFDINSIKSYQQKVKKKNSYWHISKEWIDDWNGKTQFYKRLMYEGFSLWWFERFHFFKWMLNTLTDIDAVKEFLNETNPEYVYLIQVDEYWQDIIQCVTARLNLLIEIVGERKAFIVLSGYVSYIKKILPFLMLIGLRGIQGLFRILRSGFERRNETQAKVLMFTHSMNWQKLYGHAGDKPRYFDAQSGLVLRQLLKRSIKVTALDIMSGFKEGRWSFSHNFRTFLQKKYPYVPLEGYFPYLIKVFNEIRRERYKFVRAWEDINRQQNFQQCNSFKDIDINRIIEKRLKSFITRGIPFRIGFIELFKSILKIERPDVVVLMDENGSGRPLVTAARILGIPTVGLQHGIIHELSIVYIYPKGLDRETIPLCDKTGVFGDYYKEILTKKSIYKEAEVEVTGQSRLDFLVEKNFGGGERSTTLPNLPKGKKIMLFTSQPGIGQLAGPLLMEGLGELGDDYFLVIKLHPAEPEEYSVRFYEEVADKYNVRNFKVAKQVDLYELLAICQLHIGVTSTVFSEAVVFGKPNLILDMPGSIITGGWVEQGVAMNISDFGGLKEAVETILGDRGIRERLQKAREDYIQRHYYRLDGKATERICDLILFCKN